MTILLLALIILALHLVNRLSKAKEANQFRKHAEQKAIRQSMHLDAWESGDLEPETKEDAALARRIAMGLSAKRGDVLQFNRRGR